MHTTLQFYCLKTNDKYVILNGITCMQCIGEVNNELYFLTSFSSNYVMLQKCVIKYVTLSKNLHKHIQKNH